MVDAAYAGLTPAERICVEMFESARALVEASLPAGLAPDERRFRLCARFLRRSRHAGAAAAQQRKA